MCHRQNQGEIQGLSSNLCQWQVQAWGSCLPELLESSLVTLWLLPTGSDVYFGSRLVTPVNKVHSVPKHKTNCAHLISPNSVKTLCSEAHSCVGYLRASSGAHGQKQGCWGMSSPPPLTVGVMPLGKKYGNSWSEAGPLATERGVRTQFGEAESRWQLHQECQVLSSCQKRMTVSGWVEQRGEENSASPFPRRGGK